VYGTIDKTVKEIPRVTSQGSIFDVKSYALSCRSPFTRTNDGAKVFIAKEFSKAAGILQIKFKSVHDIIM
jgi:hypothetical protein